MALRVTLDDAVRMHFSREELEEATDHFNNNPVHKGGCKIGEREFGSVYKGILKRTVVAIKLLIPKVRNPNRRTPKANYLLIYLIRMKEAKNWSHNRLTPSRESSPSTSHLSAIYE